MSYLYHMVPQDLEGSVLYPLNQLRDIRPDLYLQYLSNYRDREHITKVHIPPLNCMWNDVLFFMTVHPVEVREACEKIGYKLLRGMRFFEIDPHSLDRTNTTTMIFGSEKTDTEDFYVPYEPDNLEQYSTLSERTVENYRQQYLNGRRPALFLYIPHILYRGTLDITNARIITV